MQSITLGNTDAAKAAFPCVKWPDKITNVIFLMPPGAAKSTYLSVLYAPWHLNKRPYDLILACSYSYSLVEGFGRAARDYIDQESKTLGYTLSKSAAASGDWRISYKGKNAGGYFCAGVGSGIAGHRADVGFIDDYLGSEEDADSKQIRDKQWAWYRNDFWPRLKPQAVQVIVANRRHEEDLVGLLLAKEPEKWLVISLPMVAEANDPLGRRPGERLWPEWFTEDQVATARSSPRTWAGLYQQRPRPEDGDQFKSDWIVKYSMSDLNAVKARGLRYYIGADFAVGKGQENDSTCFLPVGVDSDDNIWVMPDWFWDKVDSGQAVEESLRLSRIYQPISFFCGREVITKAIGPFWQKRMQETGIYVPTEELSEAKDKVVKAQSIKGRMKQLKVRFPGFHPKLADVIDQLLAFPSGAHDDFVDALAKIGQGLGSMVAASVPRASRPTGLPLSPVITLDWIKRSDRDQKRLLAMDN